MSPRIPVLAVLAASLLAVSPVSAHPADRNFGLGIAVGAPTSLTGKLFLSPTFAIDMALDLQYFGAGFGLHSDLLWHFNTLDRSGDFNLVPYLGVGLELGFWQNSRYDGRFGYRYYGDGLPIGVRVPFGLALWPARVPIELFVEIGPELWVPGYINLFGSLGFRYYF